MSAKREPHQTLASLGPCPLIFVVAWSSVFVYNTFYLILLRSLNDGHRVYNILSKQLKTVDNMFLTLKNKSKMGNGIYMNCLPWTWKSHFEDTRWHFFLFSIWCEWYVWDTGQKDMDEHGFIVWAGRQMKKQRTRWCVNSTGTCGVPWSVSDYESRKLRIYTISLVCILCGDTGP